MKNRPAVNRAACDLVAAMLTALNLIELVRRDALDAVTVPNKTSLLNQPDDDPGDSSHEDIAGKQ
jgi:hypothetical protein